jgi:hypothetical protein
MSKKKSKTPKDNNKDAMRENYEGLKESITRIVSDLGIANKPRAELGTTIDRTSRILPLLLTDDTGKKRLAVNCMWQDGSGSANKKFHGHMEDLDMLRIYPRPGIAADGLMVFAGAGFPPEFYGVMIAKGAIPLRDLRQRLKKYFSISSNRTPIDNPLERDDIALGASESKLPCSDCERLLTFDEYSRLPYDTDKFVHTKCPQCASK